MAHPITNNVLSVLKCQAYYQQLDLNKVWCRLFQPDGNKYALNIYQAQSTYLD